jgi:hypothetical protein
MSIETTETCDDTPASSLSPSFPLTCCPFSDLKFGVSAPNPGTDAFSVFEAHSHFVVKLGTLDCRDSMEGYESISAHELEDVRGRQPCLSR